MKFEEIFRIQYQICSIIIDDLNWWTQSLREIQSFMNFFYIRCPFLRNTSLDLYKAAHVCCHHFQHYRTMIHLDLVKNVVYVYIVVSFHLFQCIKLTKGTFYYVRKNVSRFILSRFIMITKIILLLFTHNVINLTWNFYICVFLDASINKTRKTFWAT